jgi:hypothetical protein
MSATRAGMQAVQRSGVPWRQSTRQHGVGRRAKEVKALSDEERKKQLQAAMKGGSMVKYSSRGRATALMFFRLSADTDMLKWAPVESPRPKT